MKYPQCQCQNCGDEVPYNWEYCSQYCKDKGESKKVK